MLSSLNPVLSDKITRDANYCKRCNSQLLLLGKSATFVTSICHHNILCRRKETLCFWRICTGIEMRIVRDQVSSSFLPWCIINLRHYKIYTLPLQFITPSKLLWNWVMLYVQVLKKPLQLVIYINYVNFSWTI